MRKRFLNIKKIGINKSKKFMPFNYFKKIKSHNFKALMRFELMTFALLVQCSATKL